MQTILAIDDEISIRESYRIILGDTYRVYLAESGEEGLKLLQEKHVDLILLDLSMPKMGGMAFLEELEKRGELVPVLIVTGSNTVDIAVKAMIKGAREFVIKPFDVDDLILLVERTLEELREKRELSTLREQGVAGFENIIGDAHALREAIAGARQAMEVDSTVLVTGETGTGKDVLARAIHFGGTRKSKPFVPLSCCAIPANLVESELFGLTKGAFTGATESRVGKMQVADGGSLFLDEIGELALPSQVKLLRVLQDRTFEVLGSSRTQNVDIRVISATNRNLAEMVKNGQFREDLFYRINLITVYLPALRERPGDIPLLVNHYVNNLKMIYNRPGITLTQEALNWLKKFDFPGNIRQLKNLVERTVLISPNEKLTAEDFIKNLSPMSSTSPDAADLPQVGSITLDEMEKEMILKAMAHHNNRITKVAKSLGLTRSALYRRLEKYAIPYNE